MQLFCVTQMKRIFALLMVISFNVVGAGLPCALAQNVLDALKEEVLKPIDAFLEEAKPPAMEAEKPEVVYEEKEAPPLPEPGPSFYLHQINVEGNTQIPDDELRSLIEPFEGKEVTFSELRSLAQSITRLYQSRGYITSRAYIPPQKIEEETVVIKIIEGRVGEIFVEDNRYYKESYYQRFLEPVREDILQYQTLENALYRLNRQPDRSAKSYLIAGVEPETSDIILKVEETPPLHMGYEYRNRGTKLTHRDRHWIRLSHTNLTGNGDALYLISALANEGAFGGFFLNYSYPLIDLPLTLQLDGAYAKSMLVKHLKPLELKGSYFSLTPGMDVSWIDTPSVQLDTYFSDSESRAPPRPA